MKPYASSCDENREPILAIIQPYLSHCHSVLEIASGTGQHAVYFCQQMPHLTWQPSDLPAMLDGIEQWRKEAQLNNIQPAIELNVCQTWPPRTFDAIYSANALHIMSWHHVQCFFKHLNQTLKPKGLLLLYGPFNYQGQYTSESNARFDQWLKSRDPLSGIRDFEAIHELAEQQGLQLINDHAMPANNRTLVFQKSEAT